MRFFWACPDHNSHYTSSRNNILRLNIDFYGSSSKYQRIILYDIRLILFYQDVVVWEINVKTEHFLLHVLISIQICSKICEAYFLGVLLDICKEVIVIDFFFVFSNSFKNVKKTFKPIWTY